MQFNHGNQLEFVHGLTFKYVSLMFFFFFALNVEIIVVSLPFTEAIQVIYKEWLLVFDIPQHVKTNIKLNKVLNFEKVKNKFD